MSRGRYPRNGEGNGLVEWPFYVRAWRAADGIESALHEMGTEGADGALEDAGVFLRCRRLPGDAGNNDAEAHLLSIAS